jgi:hypothetical protein
MFGLGPAAVPTQPSSKRGNGDGAAFLEADVKNLRSEMQTDAINMGGFLFLSRVGTEDWVVKNQVSSSTTLFLDVVSILQVAYSKCTDQRTQLLRGLYRDAIQAAAAVGVHLEIDLGDHRSFVKDVTGSMVLAHVMRSEVRDWNRFSNGTSRARRS